MSLLVLACCLLSLSSQATPAAAQVDTAPDGESTLERLQLFDAVASLPARGDTARAVYGDNYGLVRVLERRGPGLIEVWRSRELRSAIRCIFVADVDLDHQEEILVFTASGKLLYYSAESFERLWESPDGEFDHVRCVAIRNVDDDPHPELIICSPSGLLTYDPVTHLRQHSREFANGAHEIAIGDVDGDGADEIVLNTGPVLDTRFLDLEWRGLAYGEHIILLDVDGDGLLEVVGQSTGRVIRVFDIDLRQAKAPF